MYKMSQKLAFFNEHSIYIYIYRERDRKREREIEREIDRYI